ncbi:ABC transporter ATP-binding protein [Bacillus sp. NSP9.1]|uniref:ABC transporter ATP-binding protein n=1 Tax=Bacillus sp. NSP9.1 TaxID=1071078 RepID=UPI00047E74DA|nr:ABC transporter ATP-binding protein [Bacillus sp. NSP9.1]QHZ47125.1 ABC transporter ATP-binding protein [Bacillus sp. NSP9.1]
MNNGQSLKKQKNHASWRVFLKFYTKIKLPWHLYILTFLLTLAMTKLSLLLVPYTSRIYQGDIATSAFLSGFILWTLAHAGTQLIHTIVSGYSRIISVRNARSAVWFKILMLPSSVYDREQPHRLISRVTTDTENAVSAPMSVAGFISAIYGITVAYLEMNKIYPDLAKLILIVVPVALIIIVAIGKLQYRIQYLITNALAQMTSFFSERLTNIQYIKTANVENDEYRRGLEASGIKYKADVTAALLRMLQMPIGYVVKYAIMIIVFAGGAFYVRKGDMQTSGLVEFYSYSLILMPRFFEIVTQWQNIKISHGGTHKIAALMDMEEELAQGNLSLGNERAGDVRFENVSFQYAEDKEALKGVNFTIPSGKVTALIGENGSGKSTVLKLLERLYTPDDGVIRAGEHSINDIKLDEWREKIGYVSQQCQVIPGTIAENIAYGLKGSYTKEELIQASKLANAYDFIMKLSDGLDTLVNSDVKLSGGELQRLAIARAIMKDPEYLLLDEATSNLDWISRWEVMKGLDNMIQGRTLIMITHDMEMARKADHIVVLKNGRVENQGNYNEVLASSETFATFIRLQEAK